MRDELLWKTWGDNIKLVNQRWVQGWNINAGGTLFGGALMSWCDEACPDATVSGSECKMFPARKRTNNEKHIPYRLG